MSQTVAKGQVWEDSDRRRAGRTFRVEDIVNNRAICKSLSSSSVGLGGASPKFTKIRLDRFVPKYYTLKTGSTKSLVNTGVLAKPKVKAPSTSWKPNPTVTTTPSSLVDSCAAKLPVAWQEVVPNVVEAVSGPFKLVVRNFRDKSYDIKVMLDGVIVDTWVASHLDVDTVLDHLRSKVKGMRDGLSNLLG